MKYDAPAINYHMPAVGQMFGFLAFNSKDMSSVFMQYHFTD
jgi:hypothetical protein